MKRSQMRHRYRDTGPDDETVALVLERDGYCCVRCGDLVRGERGVDWSVQHRRKRSAGVENRPCNLILLCGSGTTGCHGWVEHHPTLAEHEGGWAVPRYADPANVPVLVRRRYGEQWFYLDAVGGYADHPPVEAA